MPENKVSYLDVESKEFRQMMNVAEPWQVYDTILVCNTFYGAEQNIDGWFTSFVNFSQQERHVFYKNRTKGTAGLAYNNQNNADTMDFAFVAFTMGLSFFGPTVAVSGQAAQPDGVAGDVNQFDPYSYPYWCGEMPNHCSIQLKIQQDIVAEMPAMQCMPGYGPSGGAGARSLIPAVPANSDMPILNYAINQGEPFMTNRWRFPSPLGIPRTATIEGILDVSRFCRDRMAAISGPWNIAFQSAAGGPPYDFFPGRFGIQLSLGGVRLVQQRGQYFR